MPKAGIHPTYYKEATVTCSCGAVHTLGSTKDSLKVDICKECHPFYSGNQKLIDTAGRVDRFREKMAAAEALKTNKPAKKAPKVEEVQEQTPEGETQENEEGTE